MEQTLEIYGLAKKDVFTQSVPLRLVGGKYVWSNGQYVILNSERNHALRKAIMDIKTLEHEGATARRALLSFEGPLNKFEKTWEQQELKSQKAELEKSLSNAIEEKQNFLDGLMERGIRITDIIAKETEKADVTEQAKSVDKKGKVSEKPGDSVPFFKKHQAAIYYFFSWLIVDGFMTLIQWNSLRDSKSTMDLVIRSGSLAIVFYFIHAVAKLYKANKRVVYPIFTVFAFMSLFVMLFAPLVIIKAYPLDNSTENVSAQFDLSSDTKKNQEERDQRDIENTNTPLLIRFYRDYEWTPAMLCALFFMALQVAYKNDTRKKKPEDQIDGGDLTPNNSPTVKKTIPASQKDIQSEQLYNQYLLHEGVVMRTQSDLEECKAKMKSNKVNVFNGVNDIGSKVMKLKLDITENIEQWEQRTVLSDQLFALVVQDLEEYKTEYVDALMKNNVLREFVTPEWPETSDIIKYYKTHAI